MKALLVLENGASFEGNSIGVSGERVGEVVLNTSVVGYQEMMTDTTNAGKILVLTYPLIGNYGVSGKFYESKKCWISGLVIKEASRIYSNYQADLSFADFLKKEGVVTISDVDTRTIAVTIRDKGEMLGIISTAILRKEDLLTKLRSYKKSWNKFFIEDISVKSPVEMKGAHSGPRLAVLDLGMLRSFITQLKTLGCNITLLPYDTGPEDILKGCYDGLIISNGPEEDGALPRITQTVKSLLGKIPILGISTGHEVIGLALGAKLKKMKVGHHGVNYPVKAPGSYKGEITVQNHSSIIDGASLKNKRGIDITLHNINDDSIEEMESKSLKFISTQYYPASPGFDEVNNVFKRFLAKIPRSKASGQRCRTTAAKEVQYAKT